MITNTQTISEAPNVTAANISQPGSNSEGSRPGENNSVHAAVAILAIGLLAAVAGLVNFKVSAGVGR